MTSLPDIDLAMVLPALAAAILLGALAVFWPALGHDRLSARIASVTRSHPAARRLRRPDPAPPPDQPAKRDDATAGRLFQAIFDWFDLQKHAEDPIILRQLHLAGFRGRRPVVTYFALRLLLPVVLFVLTLSYVHLLFGQKMSAMGELSSAAALGALGFFLPPIYLRNLIIKRKASIKQSWPYALDLLLICVESGMSIEAAFRKVAQEIRGQSSALATDLAILNAELAILQDRHAAYLHLANRTDLDCVRTTVTSLVQAEHYGTPIGQSLRVLAQENRDMRLSEAERRAASLPPKLTVPMIVFFLPVLFAVIITPAIIQIMGVG